MFAGKKSAQIREILISESAWEEMTCLFAPSLVVLHEKFIKKMRRFILITADHLLLLSQEQLFFLYYI
uniref:Uncharacterized protein n=1 Tax=Klebsiella pneumoniae TaxID=573 RepID=A0A385FZG3_KLEPN|nr:hypothetical protein [Klebsiella pneumoniae]